MFSAIHQRGKSSYRNNLDQNQRKIFRKVTQDSVSKAEGPSESKFNTNSIALNRFPFIQTKLSINTPGDKYEQEADQIAEQVLNADSSLLQRKCSCGGECAECKKEDEEEKHLQAKHVDANNSSHTVAPDSVHEVLQSSGAPLEPATRAYMEQRFGYDFSQVRIHTDRKAAESAQAVNALAYTVGRHVVFGEGQYAPEIIGGRRLLAHELTHVIQQDNRTHRLMRQNFPGEEPLSLTQTLVISQLTIEALEHEIQLLHQWLNRQTRSTPETDRLYRILNNLERDRDRRLMRSSVPRTPVMSGNAGPPMLPPTPTSSQSSPTPAASTTNIGSAASLPRRPMISVEDQFQFLYNQMGFTNSPSGTPIEDPTGRGAGVGPARAPGYQVFSAIQVVDPQGRQVFIGYGAYLGANNPHAEEQALRNLRSQLPTDGSLRGGRLITTVTQDPCGPDRHNCAQQIQRFAQEFGLINETYVSERASLRGQGSARPPTSARGSQRTDRPSIGYRSLTPATTTTGTRADGTRNEIGTPDMRGMNVSGPSPRGENIAAGITVAFMGVNFILNQINDSIQQSRVNEALNRVEPGLHAQRQQHPELGILLVFYYSQVRAPEESIIRPGAVFGHLEYYAGRTPDEARESWLNTPAIRAGVGPNTDESTQTTWIPPVVASSVATVRTPFPSIAVGTFASGRAILQDVEWGGAFGFDDEGTSSLTLQSGQSPRFLILQVPRVMHFFNGPMRHDVDIPVEQRQANSGGTIPIVNLDPVMAGNVTAACVFPADNDTDLLFQSAVPTHDNLNQLRIYTNFGRVRWVRPENIVVSSRI